jgi:hypothetical protein
MEIGGAAHLGAVSWRNKNRFWDFWASLLLMPNYLKFGLDPGKLTR